jgi:hypothetical protein
MTRITRKFNYTQRVKIPKSRVHVEVVRGEDGKYRGMVKKLDLFEHGRHSLEAWRAAEVIVEARRVSTGSYHRQSLGAVAEVEESIDPLDLPEFPDDSEIIFRFKVVDSAKKLLGEVDGIGIGDRAPIDREPLIYLIPTDLKEELWRVDNFHDPFGPQVLVNRRLPNPSGLLTRDPLVRGLVLPQIVRQVLEAAVRTEQQSEQWVLKWMAFAERFGCGDPPDPEGEDDHVIQEWVDQVVDSFTDDLKLTTNAEKYMRARDET